MTVSNEISAPSALNRPVTCLYYKASTTMAIPNAYLDPHPAVPSDTSSFSSNFVEVTPSSIEDASVVPSNHSSNSQLHFTPDMTSNNTSESGIEQLTSSSANINRPQPGSVELPRLQTQLARGRADSISPGDKDAERPSDEARKFVSGADDYGEDGYDSELEYKNRHRLRRQMSMSAGANAEYTEDEEKEIVKKLDRRLVLFLALLYMLSFLDRSSNSLFCCVLSCSY